VTNQEQHPLEWSNALQDFLEGELDASARQSFEAHLAACEICRDNLAQFERLDSALAAALPPIALDSAFDRKLFAQIDSSDEAARAARKKQALLEMQTARAALQHSWRRQLALVIPGAAAGVTLAIALSTYIGGSDLIHTLIVDGSAAMGARAADAMRLMVPCIVGAGIGAMVARWLATVSD
jgi:anti-sigma factor RsiW